MKNPEATVEKPNFHDCLEYDPLALLHVKWPESAISEFFDRYKSGFKAHHRLFDLLKSLISKCRSRGSETACIVSFSLMVVGLPLHVFAQAPDGNEILERIDRNMIFDHAISVTTMIIHGRRSDRTVTSKSWAKGRDDVFVEYLSPPREAGKKMLKLGDKIWNYTPEPADRIITISGHLLRQSVMGSDLSYEDMMESNRLVDLYDAVVEREEDFNGRHCFVLKMTAKTKNVAYYTIRVWVDSERWLPLKEERYARRGKLLKTFIITDVFKIGDRWYPKRMVFKDMLSKGKGTEYIVESIDFDTEIPDYMMTKAALRK